MILLLVPTTMAIFGGTIYLGWRTYKSTHSPYIEEKCTSKVPLVSTSSPKMITPEELALHRSAEDGGIWMSLEGKVYDVTNFVESHPGGDKILLAAGGDVAPFWSIYGFHYESHVTDLMKEYYIGDLTVTVHEYSAVFYCYTFHPSSHFTCKYPSPWKILCNFLCVCCTNELAFEIWSLGNCSN